MMGNDVSPNLTLEADSVPTEVTLFWTINGDTPLTIAIQDECSGKVFVTVQGDVGTWKLTGMQVGVQFRLFLVAHFADGGSTNSNTVDRYAGKPCAAVNPTPTPKNYPQIKADRYPKDLNNTNRIIVSCPNGSAYDHWMLTVNGAQSDDLKPSDSYAFPAVPGQTFVLATDGLEIAGDAYTGWSPGVPVIGIKNSNSVTEFLNNSGVSGANGIKQYVRSSDSSGVRGMLGL
jgi:hypothetical protein